MTTSRRSTGEDVDQRRQRVERPLHPAACLARREPVIALVTGTFFALLGLERRFPLRPRVESTGRRLARNLLFAALATGAVQLVEMPVVLPLARWVERRGVGLLGRLPAGGVLRLALSLVLLDYTLYLWHVLTHRVPWLWRFHVVHHTDLDLDASTAVRFHFAEHAISTGWRAAQVLAIGVAPATLLTWQTVTLVSVLFHHSNVRLPIGVERWLCRVIVTPRLHGIHHSAVREETDSNWSSGLTVWDLLHGTLRLDVPEPAIPIGVPAYQDPAELTLPDLVAMPFRRQRPSWL
jgi:sterol desaturase/sphingolipid hydroxylase (fatty acid hydroxylase superfamily)